MLDSSIHSGQELTPQSSGLDAQDFRTYTALSRFNSDYDSGYDSSVAVGTCSPAFQYEQMIVPEATQLQNLDFSGGDATAVPSQPQWLDLSSGDATLPTAVASVPTVDSQDQNGNQHTAPDAASPKSAKPKGMRKAKKGQMPYGWCMNEHVRVCMDVRKRGDDQECVPECEMKKY